MQKNTAFGVWLGKLISNLASHFDLAGWKLNAEICGDEQEDGIYAHICVDSKYLNASLTYFPMARQDFSDKNYERLVEATVHELVHIFLDPFNDYASQFTSKETEPYFTTMLEQQTQKLTRVLTKTLPKNIIPR